MSGFVPIRRGFEEHLGRLGSDAVKLYLFLHLRAGWKGAKRGMVLIEYADAAAALGWLTYRVRRAMAELRRKGYVAIERHGNQRVATVVRILKFDSPAPHISVQSGDAATEAPHTASYSASHVAEHKYVRSTTAKPKETGAINAAKNLEGRRAEEAAAAFPPNPEAWEAIGLPGPVGPLRFRQAWERCFRRWDGNGNLADYVETFLVAAQDTGLKVPPRFYQAKHTLERNGAPERDEEPPHIPTLADIRPPDVRP